VLSLLFSRKNISGNLTIEFVVIICYSRPHTVIGSALCIPAIMIFAAPSIGGPVLPQMAGIVYAMLPSILINLYITGLNQITDVGIDR
jgi:homogentisate phytyltransferase/homogentisate geranylgeranyltransferase